MSGGILLILRHIFILVVIYKMDIVVQSALAGFGISEKPRPRETISKIRLSVARNIRSKRAKFSREEKSEGCVNSCFIH